MGFRFRKSVSLGKGVKLNIGKKGVSVSGGIKGLRVGIGPRGIRTSASIPGTGLSYSKNHSLKKLAGKGTSSKSIIQVVEGSQITSLLSIEAPKEIRSKFYPLQSLLGGIGILCIFASFLRPILLPIGGVFIIGKLLWRKKTDPAVLQYKDILKYYRSRKYIECIKAIDYILQHTEGNPELSLIKAECYLNIEDYSSAYDVYYSFYREHLPSQDNSPVSWSSKANAILLAQENQDFDFALYIAETLDNRNLAEGDNRLWRSYFNGLSFMGLQQYEAAIHSFQDAVGRKRSMEDPYIDAHYHMGIAYAKTGKKSLAKQRFTRVYSANTGYKNIGKIMETINTGGDLESLIG